MVYFVACIGSPVFIYLFVFLACISLLSISFLFRILLWIPLLFSLEVSLLSILQKRSGVAPRFLSEVLRRAVLHSYFVINLPGLVQFGKNLSYILPALASKNCLQQSISVKLMYQFLYLINGYLFLRYYEKVFREERNQNKKGNSQGVTTT